MDKSLRSELLSVNQLSVLGEEIENYSNQQVFIDH